MNKIGLLGQSFALKTMCLFELKLFHNFLANIFSELDMFSIPISFIYLIAAVRPITPAILGVPHFSFCVKLPKSGFRKRDSIYHIATKINRIHYI